MFPKLTENILLLNQQNNSELIRGGCILSSTLPYWNSISVYQVMLECLQRISDLSYARALVTVLLKLFQYCVKVRSQPWFSKICF